MSNKITVLADENIAQLSHYLKKHDIDCHFISGRSIDRTCIDSVRPDALLIRSTTPVDINLIKSSGIKFIATATIGTDHIDLQALNQLGIAFASAAGCSKHSVAQYVISAIAALRAHQFHGLTLGIIGLGNIGTTLANYAKKLGWQLLGYDPYLPQSTINNCVNLYDLLANSDVISLHTPLTNSGAHPTFELIDAAALKTIPPQTLLINSARGKIINNSDLIQNIDHTGRDVVLDVFYHEPQLSKTLLDRLVLATPHIAGYTLDGKLRGTDIIYQEFCRYFGLKIKTSLNELLTPSPHHFNNFRPALLSDFYDIGADDAALRACIKNDMVLTSDFDALRKNYPLRREWVY